MIRRAQLLCKTSCCYGTDRIVQIVLDSLFLTSIRSPVKGNKSSIHTEAVENGGGRHGVKDLSPVRGDEIGGDEGGGRFGSFGNDLKDGIGLFFGRQDVAQFVEAKDGDFSIEIDEAIEIFRLGEFGRQIKEGNEDSLIAFEDRVMADGAREVGFADPCRANKDQVTGFFKPVGVKKLHDLIPWDLGIESPVEIVEELDAFDSGGSHQILDSLFFSELILLSQESL